MNRSVVVVGAASVVMLATGVSAMRGAQGDQQAILRLERALTEAWSKHDTAAVADIASDDFQYWSFQGVRRTKADLLRAVAVSGEGNTAIEDPVVRVYGDAAVFTARVIDELVGAGGQSSTARTCVTDVFVRRGGRWQMVASHESKLPPTP